MTTQAIAGVSPNAETIITVEYPSISAGVLGRLLGDLYECIPLRLPFGPKLSPILFALPTSPIGVGLYFLQKVLGQRYVLTNRNIQIWTARGERMIASAPLSDVATVELEQEFGQIFFQASDIRLKKATGETLLRLRGVKDAGALKNSIEQAAEAQRQVANSMKVIAARG